MGQDPDAAIAAGITGNAPTNDVQLGVIKRNSGKSGFIQQDSGEADLFVLPIQCTGFAGQLPPIGTRVRYTVGVDPKKGLPLAHDVTPDQESMPIQAHRTSMVSKSSDDYGSYMSAGVIKKN